jgi:hypothetical protein
LLSELPTGITSAGTNAINVNPPAGGFYPTIPTGQWTSGSVTGGVFGALYQDDVSASFGGSVGHDWLVSYGAGVGFLSLASNPSIRDVLVLFVGTDFTAAFFAAMGFSSGSDRGV